MRTTGVLIFSSLLLLAASSAASQEQTVLVAGPSAELYTKPKAKGKPAATLEQGVGLLPTGKKKGKLVHVKTSKPFAVEGWIKSSETGCRVTGEVKVMGKAKEPEDEEALAAVPVLLKGAMVRVLKTKGEWIQVEAAPYPIRIFSVADAESGELMSETVYTGFILKGWIPATECSPDEKAYYDTTPKEGKLGGIVDKAAVYSEKPDEETMKSSKQLAKLEISGRALKYCRWVELEESEGWSRGYTDGPVKVKGWIQKDKLGPAPNTNPLNIIFMKDFRDYEIIAGTDLISADTKDVVAKLPGGLEVFKVGVDQDGCIVKTPSPIIVQGLVKCKYLRHLAVFPEKIIDDTGGSKNVTSPERGPKTIEKKKKKP